MFSLALVGIGSQIMLLISVVWGFRCMFSMYMVYMLLIGCLLLRLDPDDRAFILCCGAASSICPPAVIGLWLLRAVLKARKSASATLWRAGACVCVLFSLISLLVGYRQNVPVHRENIENTESATQTGKLSLRELPDDTYSWYFIPMGEFHEDYYKRYYELPETVELDYLERAEGK